MRLLLALFATAISPTANAETPMSPTAFETYAEGRTLYYLDQGQPYGAEQYLPNRRVIWTFLDGECQVGHWFEANDAICFLYEHRPSDPQCWTFYQTDEGVSAHFEGEPRGNPLIAVLRDTDPLICPGPKVGV